MKGRMLFIFNPRSGKGQIRNKLMDIIDVFVKGGYEVVVHPTQGAKDAEKMAKIMAEEVDLIVCSGGDGTLDEVVTGLMEIGASVPLGYIPAGSTNDFANSLEISRDMVKAAQDIVDGHLFSVDVGSFNEDNFIYVAAFGMFTDVSYETSQDLKNILGHLAYVMEGAKRIFDVKTYHLCVEANGEVHEGDYIYGMITNSHSVGGFRNLVGNDVEMDDGLFEVTLINKEEYTSKVIFSCITSGETRSLAIKPTSVFPFRSYNTIHPSLKPACTFRLNFIKSSFSVCLLWTEKINVQLIVGKLTATFNSISVESVSLERIGVVVSCCMATHLNSNSGKSFSEPFTSFPLQYTFRGIASVSCSATE